MSVVYQTLMPLERRRLRHPRNGRFYAELLVVFGLSITIWAAMFIWFAK